MRANSALILAVLHLFCFTGLQADVIPGRWEKVDALPSGSPIIVILKQGDRMEGLLQASTADSISLEIGTNRNMRLEKRSILKVLSADKTDDSTRNGTLIGAGIGFGAGFATMVAVEKSKTASGFELAEENLGLAVVGGLVGSAVGAVTGWAIDKNHSDNEVLYRAP